MASTYEPQKVGISNYLPTEEGAILDAHVHIMPDPIGTVLGKSSGSLAVAGEGYASIRAWARSAIGPVHGLIHKAYAGLRHFPAGVRMGVEELGALAPVPGLLIESTAGDLLSSMERNRIAMSILIAHPPVTSNERVLELSDEHPERLIPAVNFGRDSGLTEDEAVSEFRKAIDRRNGALLLKIHAASDGEDAESARYRALLDVASEYTIPVILHTGCIHAHLIHRRPTLGDASKFKSWFADWPRLPFILAHMNMHEPEVALDLAQEFENIHVDTSWQPAEVIIEAVRRIGSERIFFGSDWPLLGDNQSVALERLAEASASGCISNEDIARIQGGNLVALLRKSFAQAAEYVQAQRARDGA
jgi:predicted TIM-barrel fold metal-dependent hydrolase